MSLDGKGPVRQRILPTIPQRNPEAHKHDFGHVLVIGGSRNMPGAVALVGLAALRSGAGLVTVGTVQSAQGVVAGFSPCLMTLGLAEDLAGQLIADVSDAALIKGKSVIAVGPGLGKSPTLQQRMAHLYETANLPMVVDADALNNLSQAQVSWSRHAGPRILTPHLGEFRRMVGDDEWELEQAMHKAADFAREMNVTLVLKGHRTRVFDGEQTFVNVTGNAGLATAGTGDVLTGIIAGLLAQGHDPFHAALTGVYLHGRSGDLAATELGTHAMLATDVIQNLPIAIQEVQGVRSLGTASRIYHLADLGLWNQSQERGFYIPPSLETEGFIHATGTLEDLQSVANRFYAHDRRDFIVLELEATQIHSPVIWEGPQHPPTGLDEREAAVDFPERFPHIYGPLNRSAVCRVFPVTRTSLGKFHFHLPASPIELLQNS